MYFENYRRCSRCEHCKEITENKDGKFEVVTLGCMNSFRENVLEDDFYCDRYVEHIFGKKQMKGNKKMEENKEKSQAELLAEAMRQQAIYVADGYLNHVSMVNHPAHYANICSIECIDAMQATFGTKDLAKYCTINAYKYLWRYKSKNGLEDLKKAEWYLNKFDELLGESDNKPYSEQIPSRYVNICITLRKWLKTANTALGGDNNEE